ncbi:hypothetical protein ANCCAN_16531 [Ancylostoma caninum]|uniref:Uncharacterized protein n=1 Tax=Ancylostoma caninum TaxID=29170 RepID=A0A368FZF0_ANCCA|nr:hypothetical protein ANCCAN_16531 [Ancylostoma caninum]
MDFEFAKIPSSRAEPNYSRTTKDAAVSKGAGGSVKTVGGKLSLDEDDFRDASHQLPCKEASEKKDADHSPSEPDVCAPDSEMLVSSERSSDQNDVLSVAPSRSVCEQVETMMAGVKYCRERELGNDGRQHPKQRETEPDPNYDVPTTEVFDEPSIDSLEPEEPKAMDSTEQNGLHTEVPPAFQPRPQDECNQQKSRVEGRFLRL